MRRLQLPCAGGTSGGSVTSEEHNKMADVEAAEFLTWLDGYMEGISGREANSHHVFRISERCHFLIQRWRDREQRVSL